VGTAAAGEQPGAWGGIRTRSAPGRIWNRIGGSSHIASPVVTGLARWPSPPRRCRSPPAGPARTSKVVSAHSTQTGLLLSVAPGILGSLVADLHGRGVEPAVGAGASPPPPGRAPRPRAAAPPR